MRRLCTFGDLYRALGDVRRRGKHGVARLVAELDARDGEPPPDSELEGSLHKAAAIAGVIAVRQHPLPSRPIIQGVVDLAVPSARIILEADGRRWHARMEAMGRDRMRDREAARLGWLTLRFVYEDLAHDLAAAADDIAVVHQGRTREVVKRGRGG